MQVLTKDCVGKSSCTVPATNDHFGGDPCFDVAKRLAVVAHGCNMPDIIYNHNVKVGEVLKS